ncbi:MAG: DUF362 domain-containing protein [Desulfonatronovibrionaceae bacterium]
MPGPDKNPLQVDFFHCPDYGPKFTHRLEKAFASCGCSFSGLKVLVKPNLVAAKNSGAGCTHPAFTAEASRILLDSGAKVTVADSPAFGSAAKVAKKIGLDKYLQPLGLKALTLDRGRRMDLSGFRVLVSEAALEADVIVNLPKLKAHSQMRLSVAVKNLFGCVCGLHKALWHTRIGSCRESFAALILEVCRLFPSVFTVVDGVWAMHGTGPIHGRLINLEKIICGQDAVAVDTALYKMFGLLPAEVPLYRVASDLNLPGADPGAVRISGEQAGSWAKMRLPRTLKSADFSLPYLTLSLFKRLKQRIFPG